MADVNKLKYDIIRNDLRRMLASEIISGDAALAVKLTLEKVREKGEEELSKIAAVSKVERETVKKLTGLDGGTLRAA